MAAYGGAEAIAALGNQIFVTIKRGQETDVYDLRCKYEETIHALKRKVSNVSNVPVSSLQLFHGKKELTAEYDGKTLLDLDLHTGFSLKGYDLQVAPVYWPPVIQTPHGLRVADAHEDGHVYGYIHEEAASTSKL